MLFSGFDILFHCNFTLFITGCNKIKKASHQDGSLRERYLWIVLVATPDNLHVELFQFFV